MRPQQRCNIVEQFDKATLKSRHSLPFTQTVTAQVPGTSRALDDMQSTTTRLSVSAEDSGVTKLTLTTLQQMWEKAEELLSTHNAITPAPGSDSRAKMVMSYSSSMPHLVQRSSNGQYRCDEKCIGWISSKICSHSIAVAEVNGDLCSFLQWYNTSGTEPNITALAMSSLPSGRGRKGGVPKRKRTQKTSLLNMLHYVKQQFLLQMGVTNPQLLHVLLLICKYRLPCHKQAQLVVRDILCFRLYKLDLP